jgi:hypothetical protein
VTTPPLSFVDWNGATLVATSCQSVKVRRCTQLAAVPVELRTLTSADVDDRHDFLDRVRTALLVSHRFWTTARRRPAPACRS